MRPRAVNNYNWLNWVEVCMKAIAFDYKEKVKTSYAGDLLSMPLSRLPPADHALRSKVATKPTGN